MATGGTGDAGDRLVLTYEGTNLKVALDRAAPVAEALSAIAPTWKHNMAAGDPSGRHSLVEPGTSGFRFHSARGKAPIRGLGASGAACGVIADLLQTWLDDRLGTLGLHCGAVDIRGRVIALTGTYRTGKSTLITRLTAEPGVTVFCDDVLPVLPDGTAVGLGIAPRLRLPLPDAATPTFRQHVADNTVSADKRYAYVLTPTLASHGAQAPLGGIVVLTRDADGPARLHEVDRAEAVQQLIRQNIADPGQPLDHVDRMSEMAVSMPCFRMVYSDLEDAVDLLLKTFDAPEVPGPAVEVGPPLPPAASGEGRLADLDHVFARDPETAAREVGQDVILWQPLGRNYFHLNPVAQAIWSLLETPCQGSEIVSILAEAFPDTDRETIRSDVGRLLAQLEDRGLVHVNDATV